MAKSRAGWERQVHYDNTSGSTATTQLTHVVDADVNITHETYDNSDRGDGSAIPKGSQQVVQVKCEITLTMRYHDSDTNIANLIAHARAGTTFALKVTRRSGGSVEFDGDVQATLDHPGKLTEGQLMTFACTPNTDDRAWSFT